MAKPTVFCSRALFSTLNWLTKNQLLDLVVDLARAELGEDATDDAILAWLQPKLQTVWQHRGDRALPLDEYFNRYRA